MSSLKKKRKKRIPDPLDGWLDGRRTPFEDDDERTPDDAEHDPGQG